MLLFKVEKSIFEELIRSGRTGSRCFLSIILLGRDNHSDLVRLMDGVTAVCIYLVERVIVSQFFSYGLHFER